MKRRKELHKLNDQNDNDIHNRINIPAEKQRLRLDAILKLLQQNGCVTIEELTKLFGVSVVTVRRDLDLLANEGMLRRKHGGAESMDVLFEQAFQHNPAYQAQLGRLAAEKRRIGRAAAELISAGETIAVTPGSTTAEVIRALPYHTNLTVVTNCLSVAMALSIRKDIEIYVTGGYLRREWYAIVGQTGIDNLRRPVIHTLFLGAGGIDVPFGLGCARSDEAEINAAMVKQSRRRVAVIDHSKFGVTTNWHICGLDELDTIITDTGATDEVIAPYVNAGIEVIRV